MCGITGIFDVKKSIQPEIFSRTNDLLRHRGPDEGRTWVSENRQFALGFRRLSIIDPSVNAGQPLLNEDKSVAMICNGEIYNYLEIKELLIKNGHKFSSTSDTEVVLHGYEEWGTEVFSHLNGMFAIAITDQKNQKIILARDRFGIKPLYYQLYNNRCIFSSELRPILQNFRPGLNNKAIVNYLIYRYIPEPETIFQHTFKLPPAHFMELDQKMVPELRRYWSVHVSENDCDRRSFIEQISGLMKNSIGEHLLGAVPVGAFLSGGYDSSYVVLKMKEYGLDPMTFSLGFEKWEGSEDIYAKEVAESLHLGHKSVKIPWESFLMDEVINAWDEPLADISIIPTYYVSKLAATSHKVILSGDGADEILGGYNWYYDVAKQLSQQKRSIFRKNHDHKTAFEIYCKYSAMGLFDNEILKNSLHTDLHSAIPEDIFWFYRKNFEREVPVIKSLQLLDLRTFLPGLILPKMDRASMANSLEVRPPFLDHRIAEEIFTHKVSLYFDKDQYKKLLYYELKDKIPVHILNRKKQGFTGPDEFYQRPDFYYNLLQNGLLVQAGILNPEGLEKFQKSNQYWHLWKLAVLEKWYSKFAV